jgi:hypothetical protein
MNYLGYTQSDILRMKIVENGQICSGQVRTFSNWLQLVIFPSIWFDSSI